MNDLLILLGKRVQELRAAKKWSQEEFAHVSGFHRTYIGQIERGEKNLSFNNLVKLAGVLGVALSELLSGIESGTKQEVHRSRASATRDDDPGHQLFEIQKVARRLSLQGTALDRTIRVLDELVGVGDSARTSSQSRRPTKNGPAPRRVRPPRGRRTLPRA